MRAQLHQRRQKSRERLAGAGGRNQKRGAIVAGLGEQLKLMLARRPAAASEPLPETVRQQVGRFSRKFSLDAGRHGYRAKPSPPFRRGWRAAMPFSPLPPRAKRGVGGGGGGGG